MPKFLELAQFIDKHGVAEMQIRGSRVETGLDAQRPSTLETYQQLGFKQNFVCAAPDKRQCLCVCRHALRAERFWCGQD